MILRRGKMIFAAILAAITAMAGAAAAPIRHAAPTGLDATAGLIPRKALFGNPERASPLISPDGRKIAFLAPLNGVMNVYVGSAANVTAAAPVTREASRPIRTFQWAANGTHILYSQDQNGDENFHLFVVDLTTGALKDLTNFKDTRAEIVAQSYDRPDEILVGLNNRDPKWHDVWRINVVTGASVLVEKNLGMAGYVAANDLTLVLALRATPEGGTQVLKRAAGDWVELLAIPPDDALTTYPLAIGADGRTIYMLDSLNRDKAALTARSLDGGAPKVLGEDLRADVAFALTDPRTNRPLAFSAEYDRPVWRALDSSVAGDVAALGRKVRGVWTLLSQSRDNKVWTLRVDNVDEPVKFARYDRATKSLTTLFLARPALMGAPLVPTTPHIIKSRDGLDLVSYVSLPKGADKNGDGIPDAPVPLVLNVHGGPWARDSLSYDPEHQWLANRGYGVLSVNFRGSTGFGKAFVNAADREWGGKMQDDLTDAAAWAVKSRIAQADKIAIYGGSYGGYAALAGLTMTPKTYACGVSIVGPSNLNTLLASIPPYWTSFADTLRRRVGDPATAVGKKLLTDRSPLFRAAAIERPLLIAQGANDPRVKQVESDQIVDAMKARNIPVSYVLYADEGHGFARPENRMSFYAVTEAFLSKCLGGAVEPIGNAFQGSSIAAPAGKENVPGLAEALGMRKPAEGP